MWKNLNSITINCDGGSRGNPGPSACAFIVKDNSGLLIHSQSLYLGVATNNFAEYKAVEIALVWLKENKNNFASDIKINFILDSELVVKQLKGEWKIKNQSIANSVSIIKNLEKEINLGVVFNHVKRHLNSDADLLVNQELDSSSRS